MPKSVGQALNEVGSVLSPSSAWTTPPCPGAPSTPSVTCPQPLVHPTATPLGTQASEKLSLQSARLLPEFLCELDFPFCLPSRGLPAPRVPQL